MILIKFVKIAMLHVDLPFGLADDIQKCFIKGIFLFFVAFLSCFGSSVEKCEK